MYSLRKRIDLVKRAHHFCGSFDSLSWPSVAATTPHAFLMLLSFMVAGTMPLKTDSQCRLAQAIVLRIPALLQECDVSDFDFIMFFCLCWLFPPHMSWVRVNPRIVHVVCMIDAAAGLAALLHRLSMPCKAKRSHRHAKLIARFFPVDVHARMILGGNEACQALAAWLELLVSVSYDSQVRLQDVGVTYVAGLSNHHRNIYVGFCSGIRNTHGPCFGFAQRWYDHKVREIRVHVGQERRYKMWRACVLLHKNHATPIWFGQKSAAYKREQFILRAFTLPLQATRKNRSRASHQADAPQSVVAKPVCVCHFKPHKWQRNLPEQPTLVNVDVLLSKSWIPKLVDMETALLEKQGVWKSLAWGAMRRLGVPDTPAYHMNAAHLWVCKVATRGTKISWQCLRPALLVKMRRLAEMLASPARRAKAVERVNAALRRKQLRALNAACLVLQDASQGETIRVRRMLHELLDKVGEVSPLHGELARWWKGSLRVVKGKPITLLDRVVNHRSVAKLFDVERRGWDAARSELVLVDENLNLPHPPHARALAGKWAQSLHRWVQHSNLVAEVVHEALLVPGNCNTSKRRQEKQSCWNFVCSWFGCKKRARETRPEQLCWREWLIHKARPRRRVVAWHARELRQRLVDVEVVAQQDKCPAAVAGISREMYDSMLRDVFLQDSVHYEVLHVSAEQIVHEQFLKHVDACPAWARKRASNWTVECLPHAYINIKRKCFDASGCICRKARAHVREIIANTASPLKALFRTLSRATQCIIKHSGLHTWEVWSLKEAPSEIKRRFDSIEPRSCSCARCGARKPQVAAFQADVNQLFKDVESHQVLDHLREFVAVCETRHPVVGVTVLKTKRYQAFLGGTPRTVRGWFVLFAQVCPLMEYYLSCNVFWLGKVLIKQIRGVPMGGSASKAAASVTLGGCESRWVSDVAARVRVGFPGSAAEFCQATQGCRYVDDVLVASGIYCSRCLEDMCALVYKPPLAVGAEPPVQVIEMDGVPLAAIHHWLDLSVTIGLETQVACKSKNWAAIQGIGSIVHHSVPRCVHWDQSARQRIYWWLSSRVHRVRQADRSAQFIAQSLQELQLLGYALPKTCRVLSRFRQFEYVREALRQRRPKLRFTL